MNGIDSYIIEQIGERGLQSTKKAYESILAGIEAEIGIEPELDYDKRIEKIGTYIKAIRKVEAKQNLKRILDVAAYQRR